MADGGLKGTTTSLSDPQSAIRNPHFPAAAYWLFIGLGVLAKGPATLVFAGGFGLALLTTPGRRAWLWNWRYWVWMPLSLVLVVPWYAYAYHHGGDVLVKQFFWYEILSRIWGEPHGHGGPPGYYLLLSLAGLLPWTAFIPGTLIIAVSRRREDPRLRLLLIWLSVPWVILELIHSKLPHYILPCYVPLFTLLAWSTAESLRTMREWADVPQPERRVLNLWANINLAIGAGIACGGIVLLLRPGVAAIGAAAFGVGLVLIAGFGAARRLMRRRSLASAGAMAVAAMMLFYAGAGVWLFPSLESTRLSRNLADRLNATARAGERVLVCGYDEPSTFFYLHMPARPIKREAAAELAASLPGSMLLAITQDELARMSPEAAGPLKDRLPSEPLRGFNYVKMSSETIWLIRLKPR